MREIALSDTTKFIVDNRGKTVPIVDDGIQLIATNCINNDNLYPVYENVRFISEETYENWFRAHPIPNDIILTLKGSQNGAVCLVPDPVDFVIAQDMVALRADEKIISPYYLFAALRSTYVQFQIKNLDVSGIIPHLKKGDFSQLFLPYPEIGIRNFIGDIYFNMSRKIDLLHRQNKTLEALAETLFRQWFIEEAQDDWEEKQLDEIATFLNGLACQKFPPKNRVNRLPVLKIKDLKSGLSDSSDWATNEVDQKYIVENGDVIFSWSASLIVKVWDGEKCVLNQHLFKVTSDKYPKWFIYLWTKYHLARFIAIAETKATTMGHIRRNDLAGAKVRVPSKSGMKDFDKIFGPLIDKLIANNLQIKTLTKTRDTLLPKLMSGAVRVRYEGSSE